MKTIKTSLKLIGLLITLLIDLTCGMIITLMIIVIVFPFNFIYERLKVAYYEIKEHIL